MQIKDIILLLNANLLTNENLINNNITGAFASDLMSDVLALVKEQNVLLTGLCNTQVLRTAEMLDINCIVLVRGKIPTEDFINLATVKNICLLTTKETMFTSCGLLYSKGLHGGNINEQ